MWNTFVEPSLNVRSKVLEKCALDVERMLRGHRLYVLANIKPTCCSPAKLFSHLVIGFPMYPRASGVSSQLDSVHTSKGGGRKEEGSGDPASSQARTLPRQAKQSAPPHRGAFALRCKQAGKQTQSRPKKRKQSAPPHRGACALRFKKARKHASNPAPRQACKRAQFRVKQARKQSAPPPHPSIAEICTARSKRYTHDPPADEAHVSRT
ncbi:hypothetical protein B0H16DRAFT_1450967 [Mycena metata]|uniref:Uncharacterized protein n=1 Tax=Mycena metata TaxID=1033252 RepID=A0AAD7K0D8_9AGAR|nr:hypothetical protein B0H16DRAFT_1450967 [Mycena metata]